jgi:hypothetical protein
MNWGDHGLEKYLETKALVDNYSS